MDEETASGISWPGDTDENSRVCFISQSILPTRTVKPDVKQPESERETFPVSSGRRNLLGDSCFTGDQLFSLLFCRGFQEMTKFSEC